VHYLLEQPAHLQSVLLKQSLYLHPPSDSSWRIGVVPSANGPLTSSWFPRVFINRARDVHSIRTAELREWEQTWSGWVAEAVSPHWITLGSGL